MAETITLEGEAARALREAARRAGFADVARYAVSLAPPRQEGAGDDKDCKADGELTRGERLVLRLRANKPQLTMTSDEVMEMTRGKDWKSAVPFEDDDEVRR